MREYEIELYVQEHSTRRCFVIADSEDAALEHVLGSQRLVVENCAAIDSDITVTGTRVSESVHSHGVSEGVFNESGEWVL